MYCLKCGTQNEENALYCRNCKNELTNSHYDQTRYSNNYSQTSNTKPVDHEQYYNYSYKYSNNGENPTEIVKNHQDQYYYSYNYSNNEIISGDELYLYNYIGPSYKSIKNKKFSFSTLLFGPLYFLYRKLFYYTLLWIFALVITYYYIPNYFLLIYLAINIFIATKFSSIYLNKVEQSVDKIKHQNLELTSNELLDKCKKKGGTLIRPGAVIPILFVLGIIASILPAIYDTYLVLNENKENNRQPDIQNEQEIQYQNEIIKDLNFKIPEGFTSTYNSNYSKTYTYQDTTDYCRIGIYINDYISSYQNDEEYLKSNIYIENPPQISYTTLNNTPWAILIYNPTPTTTYYNYAHIYNNIGYLITYDIVRDETSTCSKNFLEFISSLYFK